MSVSLYSALYSPVSPTVSPTSVSPFFSMQSEPCNKPTQYQHTEDTHKAQHIAAAQRWAKLTNSWGSAGARETTVVIIMS